MSVALSVAFTGLCALVTGAKSTPGEVLLVDAKGVGEVRGVTLPEHAPTLVVSLRELANAESSNPTRVVAAGGSEQIGLWDLSGSEVRIRAQGRATSGVRLFRSSEGPNPRNVQDPLSWRDIRLVPDMKVVVGDGRIDPALVGSIDAVATQLPRSVAARVFLDGGLLEGGLPSREGFRDKLFEFRGRGSDAVLRQPLTDTARWSVESDAAAIVIDITPVNGGRAKRLLLAPSSTPHRVFVSNLPTENPSHDHSAMSEEEMNAVHFGAYYKLLLNEPDYKPVPMVWRPDTRNGTGFVDGGFCPGALFNRE